MKILLIIVAIILLLGGFWLYNTQSRLYTVNVPLPDNFPDNGFSHQQFETLLKKFVDQQGNVDYQAWVDTNNAQHNLTRYLAAVAQFSPENSPERFATEQHALAFWIYSYNALVIHSILLNWPLESVTDIKAPVEVIKGLGFFYNQKFIIGGKPYNLYQLEQQKMVHTKADPRLHFVLNCASASCPAMRPQLPVGVELEPFLQQATVDFINNPENVYLDSDCKNLHISRIFQWYGDDFATITPSTDGDQKQALKNYIKRYAGTKLKSTLNRCEPLTVTFMAYDWTINKSDNP
jgi:hypothetical protein